MTRAKRRARRLRLLILLAGIVYTLAALFWMVCPYFNEDLFLEEFAVFGLMGSPLGVDQDPSEIGYAVNIALVVGLILLAQWAFLRPSKAWTPRLTAHGRPLRPAVIVAAAMAMLLSVGLIALLLELPDWWESVIDMQLAEYPWGIWPAMLLLWGVRAWIFLVYWRQGDRYTQLGRMIRALVAGSLAEVVVAVPVHVWAMRSRDCYCARGTYTTLVLAGVVLLWAFGPGIILLYMRENYRRARLFPSCQHCGYSLIGNTSGRCPECGESTS